MKSSRHAFTLVELLVVIAIIGVLIGLLLPAVQAARESARRTHCMNNLKQIGLGLQLYHDSHHRLPPGWLADVPDGEPGWGWGAFVLPFLEQDNLMAHSIDTTAHIDEPENDAARRTVISTYLCPSDRFPDVFMLSGLHTPLFEVGKTNYVGVYGPEEVDLAPSDGEGVFYHNSPTRLRDVVDGLSNTLFVGERCSRLGYSTWVGVVHGSTDPYARVVGSADHTPNHPASHFEDFSSFHTNGVNFVMGDGSVIRLNDEIDINVYRGLSTRFGNEVAQPPVN